MNRRELLRLVGALPFLPALRPRSAWAQGQARPKRLVMFHTPQGTVMDQWLPRGGPRDFELPYITAPLDPLRERLVVVSGVDNRMPEHNQVGNAHLNANYTVLTGRPFAEQDEARLSPAGPSIEQVVARRISTDTPFPRLDFAVGGTETANGVFTPREGAFYWNGPFDPVAVFNSPVHALLRIFGDADRSPADRWAERARRASVLDGVLRSFDAFGRDLPAADRERLGAHAEKLRQLESRIVAGTGACAAPTFEVPPGFAYGIDEAVAAPLQTELLVTALACDLTRVATFSFANGHAPEFPWLWARNGGAPIVDLAVWENWHAMVHADYQPGMEHPFRWYNEVLADLLTRMAATTDADGDNLLDTSLVVAFSEYSSGRHWNTALPIVLAGNLGGARTGRWLDHLAHPLAELTGYSRSGFTTNQLWTSVLHAFGFDDAHFGHEVPELPAGPLPGLL